MSAPAPARRRLDYLDYVRGLAIVLMALDHTRDFWGVGDFGAPENPAAATPAAFFTRWITHFCAPTFVFLAGVGAWLYQRKKTPLETAGFLFSRGLWLIFLEFTLVKFGWSLNFTYGFVMMQVIWATGVAMLLLSALVFLSPHAALALGLTIIVGHNALDALPASSFGRMGWLWELAHTSFRMFRPVPEAAPKLTCMNLYPFLPWFGVIALGYGLGELFTEEKAPRWRLIRLGLAMTAAFLLLRWLNGYGNPVPWREQKEELRTAMSFLNCTKYPPSLDFLLMTLGPALLLLGVLPAEPGWAGWPFVVFGRVPLFFYLLHLPTIHGVADWFKPYLPQQKAGFLGLGQPQRGLELPGVYLVWAAAVVLLFFPCWGYSKLKAKYGGLLRYL